MGKELDGKYFISQSENVVWGNKKPEFKNSLALLRKMTPVALKYTQNMCFSTVSIAPVMTVMQITIW